MGRYQLGATVPYVRDVAETVGAEFDVATIGGWRASAFDMQGHPAGLALDFQVGADKAKGEAIAAYFARNAARLHVRYVIWDQKLWKPSAPTWQMMATKAGTKPGYDPNHKRHVHVSFTPDVGDGRRMGGSDAPSVLDTFGAPLVALLSPGAFVAGALLSGEPIKAVAAMSPAMMLSSALMGRDTWKRAALVLGGFAAIGVGVAILSKDLIGPALSTAAGVMPQGRAAKAVLGAGAAAKSVKTPDLGGA
jgi:hypothetical protein